MSTAAARATTPLPRSAAVSAPEGNKQVLDEDKVNQSVCLFGLSVLIPGSLSSLFVFHSRFGFGRQQVSAVSMLGRQCVFGSCLSLFYFESFLGVFICLELFLVV